MRIPLKQECHSDSAMPKIPVHQTVNYNQSLNYRLLGRAFHTIKSYLKHSDLRRKIVKNSSFADTSIFCNRSWCPFRLCRVRTYFRSQIAISESEPVYCTSLLSPTVYKWFCHTVPSGPPCTQVRSRTISVSSRLCYPHYRLTRPMLPTFNSHHLCEGHCISRLLRTANFRTTAWKWGLIYNGKS